MVSAGTRHAPLISSRPPGIVNSKTYNWLAITNRLAPNSNHQLPLTIMSHQAHIIRHQSSIPNHLWSIDSHLSSAKS